MARQFVRRAHSFGQLRNIISQMKPKSSYPARLQELGTSGAFDYAIPTKNLALGKELATRRLETWDKFQAYDVQNSYIKTPLNGFEEMITWTEQGRLWKYPIDNECGMDAEKKVHFEEHVFLERHLDGFPKNDFIQELMHLVIAGLAKNHWMTVERKQDAIKFYKDYFESKKDIYKQVGFELKWDKKDE